MSEVTRMLSAIEGGDPHAAEQLLPLVYDELRKLAAQKLAQEKPGQTLQATALVHEAYLRLVGSPEPQNWNGRGHFFGAAALAMRRILVESARRKRSGKHGGEEVAATVPPLGVGGADQPEVRLVDQGGRLQGVAGRLGGELGGGEATQLGIDQREQLGGGARVALGDGVEDL